MEHSFIYADDTQQYAYSAGRSAVAEYYRRHDGTWGLSGWLWDGKVTSRSQAVELLTEYLKVWAA